MEDTVKTKNISLEIAQLLEDHKGRNTKVLYIGARSSWTDYFIITTVTSGGHMRGVLKHLKSFLQGHNIREQHKQKKLEGDDWVLLDCGQIIIHLMTEATRDFYELEKLWFSGNEIFQSSKSS